MTSQVNYELSESVATITLDDGKVNVLGPTMQSADQRGARPCREGRRQGRGAGGQPAGVQRRIRPVGVPVRRRAGGAGDAGGRVRVVGAVPDVPEAGHHGRDGSGHRDGLVSSAERRPPGRRPEVAVPGHRGGDRHDDSDLGDRDHADAVDACGLPPRHGDGVDVRRRRGDRRGLARRDRRRGQGAGARAGDRDGGGGDAARGRASGDAS